MTFMIMNAASETEWAQNRLHHALMMDACPYLNSTGDMKCASGCWEEPRCITEAPDETGWTREIIEARRGVARLLDSMTTMEDARQRFLTEGTAEAAECYRRTVREVASGWHDEVDGMCGPDARGCGGQTFDPPCGGCVDCLHAQTEHSLFEYRVEAQAW